MSRTVWLILVGAVVGSAAVAISFEAPDAVDTGNRARDERGRAEPDDRARPSPEALELERIASERAAGTSDVELDTQRTAALAMLDALGYDEQGITTIAATLPPIEARSFRFDAIARLAERDIGRALELAAALVEPAAQAIILERIAVVAAAFDPGAGLQHASSLSTATLRQRFLDRLLDAWAERDPDAVLTYLETADLSDMPVTDASFRALAASRPEALLALAERFAPALRIGAQSAAVDVLAAADPAAAYERVTALSRSSRRDALIDDIATVYAQKDPEAALAWAASLEPPSRVAMSRVLIAASFEDPLRAAEFKIDEIVDPVVASRGEMPIVPFLPMIQSTASATNARIADLLSAHSDPRVRAQQRLFVLMWAQSDARAALDWIDRNPRALTAETARWVASSVVYADTALAKEAVQRLPPPLRAAWIEGAARGMAERDLDATLAWIGTMRGEPVYERALESVLEAGASAQPVTVASHLERTPALIPRLAATVASAWAAQDAPAAAVWLTSRANVDEATLTAAAAGVAAAWGRADAQAAERWVRGLPSAAARDEGFSGLLGAAARSGSLDERLLDEFSSQAARDRALAASMFTLAQTNVLLARRLVAQITDPALRARAESRLEEGASLPDWARTASSAGGR